MCVQIFIIWNILKYLNPTDLFAWELYSTVSMHWYSVAFHNGFQFYRFLMLHNTLVSSRGGIIESVQWYQFEWNVNFGELLVEHH